MNLMMNRRRALQLGVNALGSGALLATLGGFERALAASAPANDYRALVCVFLAGGCDTANLVVPTSGSVYQLYARIRQTLALPSIDLLGLNSLLDLPLLGGVRYGLHPSCAGLQSLYDSGRLAIVANTGPLAEPLTRADYVAGRATLPPQLFSHIDQQHLRMSATADAQPHGWAGRVADLLAAREGQPELAMNVSIGGANLWQSGAETLPYVLSADGAPRMRYWQAGDSEAVRRRQVFTRLLDLADADGNPLVREYSRTQRRGIDTAERVASALDAVPAPSTTFPQSYLGKQLAMAARLIGAREALGVKRQMIFVMAGGWDTHANQLSQQTDLFADLSASLTSFHRATEELAIADSVTSFTATDFGRTLTRNGDGTDHGWGSHALVLGGAVRGGGIYGRMPDMATGSADDAGSGRIIPQIATEQYAATLARWFGVAESDIDTVFPTLGRFASRDLGIFA
ncbi:MAG TPA: DUF1501 domain-containing protein [Solimonas sp.]|nr:DUF1501 domain-containing protein [Solimonas sp.]